MKNTGILKIRNNWKNGWTIKITKCIIILLLHFEPFYIMRIARQSVFDTT